MENQCTATAKSTGERCQKSAMKGATVCSVHGGKAPQVQKKAQERLDEMADSVTADVQKRIKDLRDVYDNADDEEKVMIMRELRQLWTTILDRTDHGPTERHEHTGDDGGPLEIAISETIVETGYDDAE